MSKVIEILENDHFLKQLKKAKDEFTVVFFYGMWSGDCRLMDPVFEELSKEHTGIHFLQVQTEECPITTEERDVSSDDLPVFQFYRCEQQIKEIEIKGASEMLLRLRLHQLIHPGGIPPTMQKSTRVATVTENADFLNELTIAKIIRMPALVFFFADASFRCRELFPIFKVLAKVYGNVHFVQLHTRQCVVTTADYDVKFKDLPVLKFFKDEKYIEGKDLQGLIDKEEIEDALDGIIHGDPDCTCDHACKICGK